MGDVGRTGRERAKEGKGDGREEVHQRQWDGDHRCKVSVVVDEAAASSFTHMLHCTAPQ